MKPCPFCRSTNIKYSVKTARVRFKDVYRVCMYCADCNTYGPRVIVKPEEEDAAYSMRTKISKDSYLQQFAEQKWDQRC